MTPKDTKTTPDTERDPAHGARTPAPETDQPPPATPPSDAPLDGETHTPTPDTDR